MLSFKLNSIKTIKTKLKLLKKKNLSLNVKLSFSSKRKTQRMRSCKEGYPNCKTNTKWSSVNCKKWTKETTCRTPKTTSWKNSWLWCNSSTFKWWTGSLTSNERSTHPRPIVVRGLLTARTKSIGIQSLTWWSHLHALQTKSPTVRTTSWSAFKNCRGSLTLLISKTSRLLNLVWWKSKSCFCRWSVMLTAN